MRILAAVAVTGITTTTSGTTAATPLAGLVAGA